MKGFKRFFLDERNIMVVILINAAIIFVMYFPQYKDNFLLEIIDHFFILVFVVEAIVKMQVLGIRGYFSYSWNRFDFAIIIASLPALLVHFIQIPDTSLLIILRLFRLVRLIRFIRFIPNLGKIMSGLGRALKASVFVFAALLFLNFLLALFTCHFYGDIAEEYFGDPLVSAYSIFQMFTVEGWNEIPQAIVAKTDNTWIIGATRIYFVLVVLTGGIFGMSLANAVFVDEMTVDNNKELEVKIDQLNQEISELKDMLRTQVENNQEKAAKS